MHNKPLREYPAHTLTVSLLSFAPQTNEINGSGRQREADGNNKIPEVTPEGPHDLAFQRDIKSHMMQEPLRQRKYDVTSALKPVMCSERSWQEKTSVIEMRFSKNCRDTAVS